MLHAILAAVLFVASLVGPAEAPKPYHVYPCLRDGMNYTGNAVPQDEWQRACLDV